MQPLRDIFRTRGSNRRGGYRGRIIGIVAIVGLLFTACETAPPPGPSGGYNLTTPSVVGNLGSYRLQLVSSPGIESYRSDLQAVASELNGIVGRPAFVVDSQLGSSVSAERGVIKIAVAQSAFGCGSAAKTTVTAAWGAPCLSEQRNTRYFWTAGIVTLTDNYPACGRRPVLRHEIGHALDLRVLERAWTAFDSAGQSKSARATLLATRSPSGARYVHDAGSGDFNVEQALDDSDGAFRKAAGKDKVARDTSGRTTVEGSTANLSGGVTSYSDTDYEELFAESFALYSSAPETLRQLRPNIYNYFSSKYPRPASP